MTEPEDRQLAIEQRVPRAFESDVLRPVGDRITVLLKPLPDKRLLRLTLARGKRG